MHGLLLHVSTTVLLADFVSGHHLPLVLLLLGSWLLLRLLVRVLLHVDARWRQLRHILLLRGKDSLLLLLLLVLLLS